MGFTTGLLGGFTLTTTLLYLSLDLHNRNRTQQAIFVRQQALILGNIVEPRPILFPPTSREVPAGILETAKDRWNAELESNMRKVNEVDWEAVRERAEDSLSSIWRRLKDRAKE